MSPRQFQPRLQRAVRGASTDVKKRKPAAPYSPAGESRSTLGEEALDFRVRNGNGYDSLSMATGKKVCRADGLKGIAAQREGDPCHNEVCVDKD